MFKKHYFHFLSFTALLNMSNHEFNECRESIAKFGKPGSPILTYAPPALSDSCLPDPDETESQIQSEVASDTPVIVAVIPPPLVIPIVPTEAPQESAASPIVSSSYLLNELNVAYQIFNDAVPSPSQITSQVTAVISAIDTTTPPPPPPPEYFPAFNFHAPPRNRWLSSRRARPYVRQIGIPNDNQFPNTNPIATSTPSPHGVSDFSGLDDTDLSAP